MAVEDVCVMVMGMMVVRGGGGGLDQQAPPSRRAGSCAGGGRCLAGTTLESSLPTNIDRDMRSKCAYNKAKKKPNCTNQKLICGHRVVEYA